MPPRTRYSQQDKEIFWARLARYREALQSGDSHAIVTASLSIHAALGSVPKDYKRYVTAAFNERRN